MSSSAASATAAGGPLKKDGRFEESVSDAVEKLTESIIFDKALYKHDIMGNRAFSIFPEF